MTDILLGILIGAAVGVPIVLWSIRGERERSRRDAERQKELAPLLAAMPRHTEYHIAADGITRVTLDGVDYWRLPFPENVTATAPNLLAEPPRTGTR